MANGQRGLVCQYDVVCFDEVAGISFDQKDGVLHAVSAETQVILFTHEEDVQAWARRRLSGPRDALTELPRPG